MNAPADPRPACRLVRRADQPVMPWQNGGGSTRQVAIEPADGSLANGFTWRVSCAQVDSDGPFSRLLGVDRSLWLWRGRGLRLSLDGQELLLATPYARCDFAGEVPVAATRLDGACEDVNVMTNRARCRAFARIVALHAGHTLRVPSAPQWLLLVLDGVLDGAFSGHDGEANELAAGDALRGEGAGPQLCARTHGTALVVAFTPLAEAR
ncbi:MAG: HutD family protein [Planctomycetota bacterium]